MAAYHNYQHHRHALVAEPIGKSPLTIFIATIVLATILLVLIYPLVTHRRGREMIDDSAFELAQRLRRSRDRVYEEIRALQQEYFLGNLTEEEHQRQFQNARLEAAELMRQQQQIQQTITGIEAEVEAELLQITTDISNHSERHTK